LLKVETHWYEDVNDSLFFSLSLSLFLSVSDAL
jgi:hypothetical protein